MYECCCLKETNIGLFVGKIMSAFPTFPNAIEIAMLTQGFLEAMIGMPAIYQRQMVINVSESER